MTSNGMRNKKNILIAILFLILLGSGFYYFGFSRKEISTEKAVKPLHEVVLYVLDNTYKINIGDGSSVYDAMNMIESSQENNENKFSFKTKEYPGLGYFVEEINGVKEGGGKYWIYYVNGKEASVGIRDYIVKEGDIINWKQK